MHAGRYILATVYFVHDDLHVPQNLLVLAHSIEVVVDLSDFLGLFYDESLLFDNIILDCLEQQVCSSFPLRSDIVQR